MLEFTRANETAEETILGHRHEAGWERTSLEGEIWVATDGSVVVGSLQLVDIADDIVLVDAVVVPESRRGEGIGGELMRRVLTTREAEWWLECREERIAFYRCLGFALVAASEVPAPLRAYLDAPGVLPSDRENHFMRLASDD